MENAHNIQTRFLSLISIILWSSLSLADGATLERPKEAPPVEDPESSNIVFIFSGDQAQGIINKLSKAETRNYKIYGGNLKVLIGTNVICLDRSPSTDDKSASCRMVVDEKGNAVDVRQGMKSFLDSLNSLPTSP